MNISPGGAEAIFSGGTDAHAAGAAGRRAQLLGLPPRISESRSEPSQIHSGSGKTTNSVLFVQMTMAVGLRFEVLLAALQHFVLLVLPAPLIIPPAFPTEILKGYI